MKSYGRWLPGRDRSPAYFAGEYDGRTGLADPQTEGGGNNLQHLVERLMVEGHGDGARCQVWSADRDLLPIYLLQYSGHLRQGGVVKFDMQGFPGQVEQAFRICAAKTPYQGREGFRPALQGLFSAGVQSLDACPA